MIGRVHDTAIVNFAKVGRHVAAERASRRSVNLLVERG